MAGAELHVVEAAGIAVLGQTHGGSIVDQSGLHVAAPENVGKRGVFGGKSLPACERQRVATRHGGPAHRNGGEAFAVGVFEKHSVAGEAVKVGSFHFLVAVAAKIVELQRVQHDEHDILDLLIHV